MSLIKKITQKVFFGAQKVIMAVSVFFLYYFIFGLTVIASLLFNRRLLYTDIARTDTFWVDAEGYDEDMASSRRES